MPISGRIPVNERKHVTTPDIPDTGDVIDPTAPDPTPPEITDPAHPDHVTPFAQATPATSTPEEA
jgi:hypothetical protein